MLLSGEPGIGKSRLDSGAARTRSLRTAHAAAVFLLAAAHRQCVVSDHLQMERAAGFAHDDTAQAKLDKLDALLAQSFTPRQDAALFADMLSLPNDGRYPTLDLAPQQRRQRTPGSTCCANGGAVAIQSC